MIKKIGEYGKGPIPHFYHEIKEKFLKKEVHETLNLIEGFNEQWIKLRCTLLSDGWSNRNRRSICNFLVNRPKGTVFLHSLDASDILKTIEKVFPDV